jgi:hypothetical protein
MLVGQNIPECRTLISLPMGEGNFSHQASRRRDILEMEMGLEFANSGDFPGKLRKI